MRYLLIINPEAQLGIPKRKQDALIKMAHSVLGKGEVFIVGKDRKEALQDINFDTVIFCGGDGTLHHGIQYLPLTNVKIGLVPLGSGVDFATALKIPKRNKEAFEIIHQGKTKQVDLGRINGRLFANTVSFGFDAFINLLQHGKIRPKMKKIKKLLIPVDAKWCYVLALLYYFLPWVKFTPIRLQISTESIETSGIIHLLAITNSFRYGGGFRINPYAKPDDGVLDACLVSPLGKHSILAKLYSTRRGTHIYDKKVQTFCFERMTIQSETPITPQADGEILQPDTYFRIEVLKGALKIFAP